MWTGLVFILHRIFSGAILNPSQERALLSAYLAVEDASEAELRQFQVPRNVMDFNHEPRGILTTGVFPYGCTRYTWYLYICVCVYIYIVYIYIYCIYIYILCVYIYIVCIYIYILYIYIYTYMHACMHTYIQTYMHACMHTCMHAYIHTYIHTYILCSTSFRALHVRGEWNLRELKPKRV